MEKKRIGIIGGGISGTCLGYHLSLYDNAEVIVFEKDTIGGASTAKSAGTVCLFDDSLRNRYWDVRLYGFESYLKMEAEEKGSAGFDKTGTLVVATDEKVEATIKTGIALAKAAGYTGEYITDKDRIKEILPDISTDNILGAGYTQDDGYFDGTMISNTYAKKMQKNGGVIKTGVKVTEVLKEGNKIKGLKTDDGQDYEFDYVVDCTGPWSKFTGEMVGMDVPIWHTKAEAFFLCPPGKKLGYTFPVLKYPAFYALRAGDNIFICKSHLSMDLSNPMHAGQWDPDKLPVRSVRVQGTGNRGQRTGIILAFIPCGAKGFPSDSGRDTGGGLYPGNRLRRERRYRGTCRQQRPCKIHYARRKDTFIGRLGV